MVSELGLAGGLGFEPYICNLFPICWSFNIFLHKSRRFHDCLGKEGTSHIVDLHFFFLMSKTKEFINHQKRYKNRLPASILRVYLDVS